LAFLALSLTLGPIRPYFPLYQFFYDHLPFFKYPRVPARFVMIGFRVHFSGEAPLDFNLAVIGFSDQKSGPGLIEAEDLFRPPGGVR
jgi:hypothetical protein